jgi:TRAP-type C4-dicarboxylate transport system permease small subunit
MAALSSWGAQMRLVHQVDKIVGSAFRAFSIGLLVALLLLLAANVTARLTGLYSLGWYDEVIEITFAWMVFISAAALWREHEHFRIDWLPNQLHHFPRKIHGVVVILINLAFLYFLFTQGLQLALKSRALTPVLDIPVFYSYLCIPLSAGIMSIYSLRDLFVLCFSKQDQDPADIPPIDDL